MVLMILDVTVSRDVCSDVRCLKIGQVCGQFTHISMPVPNAESVNIVLRHGWYCDRSVRIHRCLACCLSQCDCGEEQVFVCLYPLVNYVITSTHVKFSSLKSKQECCTNLCDCIFHPDLFIIALSSNHFCVKKASKNYLPLLEIFFLFPHYSDTHYGIRVIKTTTWNKTIPITQRKYILCANIFCMIKIVINLHMCINNII